MKIKVSASFTGVISRGAFENSRPGFAAEVEMELAEGTELLPLTNTVQKDLQKICYDNFKACEEQAIIERVNREFQNTRWYTDEQGKKVPSVTSVIGFDADMYCTPEQLAQYAAQSNICHAQVEHYIKTGEWKEAKDTPGTWADIVIVKKGQLALDTEGWSFPDFLKKYPIKDLKNAKSSINETHKYGGTPDFEGVPDFKGADPLPSLCDVKRTVDKIKNFKQISAYCKMKGNEHIKQMIIVPLNNKTEQGFSKPVVETRIDQYFEMFLKDRENFARRFGV